MIKMNMAYNKKALTVKLIIGLIILIVSFGIIALFFATYGFPEEIDKEACHQSVIYKASVPDIDGKDVLDLPLNCKTEKICISMDKNGNCDEDFRGEKYDTKKVSDDAGQREQDMRKIFADAMAECWWMMGQGKAQVFTRGTRKNNDCVLCTRLAFDKDLKTDLIAPPYGGKIRGLTKYMISNNALSSEKTYWQYITNSESNFRMGYDESKDVIDLNVHPQKVIVFAETKPGSYLDLLIGTAATGGVAGGILAGATVGSVVPVAGTLVGGGIGAVIGFLGVENIRDLIQNSNAKAVASVSLKDYNFDTLKNLNCTSFES